MTTSTRTDNPSSAKPEQTLDKILENLHGQLLIGNRILFAKDDAAAAIQQLIKQAIGKNESHGSGKNIAWEASIDYRNQAKDRIRENFRSVGLLP